MHGYNVHKAFYFNFEVRYPLVKDSGHSGWPISENVLKLYENNMILILFRNYRKYDFNFTVTVLISKFQLCWIRNGTVSYLMSVWAI